MKYCVHSTASICISQMRSWLTNRWCFSFCPNVCSDWMWSCRWAGRLFHILAPATAKFAGPGVYCSIAWNKRTVLVLVWCHGGSNGVWCRTAICLLEYCGACRSCLRSSSPEDSAANEWKPLRRTPTPTPYITWNASATVILLLDVEESASQKHHLWTFELRRWYAVRWRRTRTSRRTPYMLEYETVWTFYPELKLIWAESSVVPYC